MDQKNSVFGHFSRSVLHDDQNNIKEIFKFYQSIFVM